MTIVLLNAILVSPEVPLKSKDFILLGSRMLLAISPLDLKKLTFWPEVVQRKSSWNVLNGKGSSSRERDCCNLMPMSFAFCYILSTSGNLTMVMEQDPGFTNPMSFHSHTETKL